jgi:hypothetical protein
LKNFAFVCASLVLFPVAAKAQDYLYINNPLNDGNTITGDIIDPTVNVDVDAYIGSLNGTLDENGNDIFLPMFDCVDIQDDISIPTSYQVTPTPVWNAAAWLISNEGAPAGGLTDAQDAGLQMAIWDVTYPGVTYANVTGEGSGLTDPTYWEGVYLAADNYGQNMSEGVELIHVGGYGQNMEYAPTGGGPVPGLPGPLAALPFLAGLAGRRRRNSR